MPTYDYICAACDHRLELFQSMTEAPKRKCPACGKQKLERQIGAGAGILFKGSGFYQTDYRSDSYQKGAKADSAAGSSEGSSGGEGSSSKSDGKSDSSSKAPAAGSGSKPGAAAKDAPKKKSD